MRCQDALARINAAVDGSLGVVSRSLLQAHLLRCAACRAEMEATRSLSAQLASLPAVTGYEEVRQTVKTMARSARPADARTAGRALRSRLVAAVGVSALLGAIGLALLTRPSAAEVAYNEVVTAAAAVKSYHVALWALRPNGSRETAETWYVDGKWRVESRVDGELTKLQVYDGQKLHLYDVEDGQVWLNASDDPFPTEFRGFTVAAMLESAGQRMDDVTFEQIHDQAGHSLNRFVIASQGGQGRVIILADAETDLPRSVEYYALMGTEWELVGAAERIEYNVAVSPERFTLTPPEGAEVIDKALWIESFWARYEQGMDSATTGGHECILRDFQAAKGGDVFAIWSWPGYQDSYAGFGSAPVPNMIYGAPAILEDSLGTNYIYSRTGILAGRWGDGYGWFIAETPPPSQPAWYRLTLTYAFRKGGPGEGFDNHTVSFRV
jgi:outer membrane lipoprotein-sorting protein